MSHAPPAPSSLAPRHLSLTSADEAYTWPRKNFEALAGLGVLGLLVPTALGGRGENHVCASMVVETLARFGCASTAMCYVMHTGAVAALLLRHHTSATAQALLRRLDRDVLVGTLSYSDPATGGHFWYPLSSKAREAPDGRWHVLKWASWTTSAGFADWYVVQTTSPAFGGAYANLSCFLAMADEVRANVSDWAALGLHGNQSGPMLVDALLTADRLVGPVGDGAKSNDEVVDPFFLLLSSSCWNGLALAAIDLAKRQVTQKRHADVGLRVCDYPTIQDYFGDCVADVNASRAAVLQVAQALDAVTNQCDWSLHEDVDALPRSAFLPWGWQIKYTAAKVAGRVVDEMLHAAGGSGYKRDLGLERVLRDAKAGWVMGPSNEVLRQFIGKTALLGDDALDYWATQVNERALHTELKKLDVDAKAALIARLQREIAQENAAGDALEHDADFLNPFQRGQQCSAPALPDETPAALCAGAYVTLRVTKVAPLGASNACYTLALPSAAHVSGLLPGQYVRVRATLASGKASTRYFSPVSHTRAPGVLELVMNFKFEGDFTRHFRTLKPGDTLDVEGPVGGFEYTPSQLDELVLLAGGGGITPALQLVREVMADVHDTTRVTLLWTCEHEDEFLYKDELDAYAARTHRPLRVFYTCKNVRCPRAGMPLTL